MLLLYTVVPHTKTQRQKNQSKEREEKRATENEQNMTLISLHVRNVTWVLNTVIIQQGHQSASVSRPISLGPSIELPRYFIVTCQSCSKNKSPNDIKFLESLPVLICYSLI